MLRPAPYELLEPNRQASSRGFFRKFPTPFEPGKWLTCDPIHQIPPDFTQNLHQLFAGQPLGNKKAPIRELF